MRSQSACPISTEDATYSIFEKIVYVGPGGSLWGAYGIVQSVNDDPAGGLDLTDIKHPKPGIGQY